MPKWLTLTEVGAVLSRSPRAMQMLMYRGKFPCSHVSGRMNTLQRENPDAINVRAFFTEPEANRHGQEIYL
jgi:hypothetical protein